MQSVIRNTARIALVSGAFLLAGCASHVYEASTADNEYTLGISVPNRAPTPAAANDILANKAAEACPAGYQKENETTGNDQREMVRWRIHCGDSIGDVSEGGS